MIGNVKVYQREVEHMQRVHKEKMDTIRTHLHLQENPYVQYKFLYAVKRRAPGAYERERAIHRENGLLMQNITDIFHEGGHQRKVTNEFLDTKKALDPGKANKKMYSHHLIGRYSMRRKVQQRIIAENKKLVPNLKHPKATINFHKFEESFKASRMHQQLARRDWTVGHIKGHQQHINTSTDDNHSVAAPGADVSNECNGVPVPGDRPEVPQIPSRPYQYANKPRKRPVSAMRTLREQTIDNDAGIIRPPYPVHGPGVEFSGSPMTEGSGITHRNLPVRPVTAEAGRRENMFHVHNGNTYRSNSIDTSVRQRPSTAQGLREGNVRMDHVDRDIGIMQRPPRVDIAPPKGGNLPPKIPQAPSTPNGSDDASGGLIFTSTALAKADVSYRDIHLAKVHVTLWLRSIDGLARLDNQIVKTIRGFIVSPAHNTKHTQRAPFVGQLELSMEATKIFIHKAVGCSLSDEVSQSHEQTHECVARNGELAPLLDAHPVDSCGNYPALGVLLEQASRQLLYRLLLRRCKIVADPIGLKIVLDHQQVVPKVRKKSPSLPIDGPRKDFHPQPPTSIRMKRGVSAPAKGRSIPNKPIEAVRTHNRALKFEHPTVEVHAATQNRQPTSNNRAEPVRVFEPAHSATSTVLMSSSKENGVSAHSGNDQGASMPPQSSNSISQTSHATKADATQTQAKQQVTMPAQDSDEGSEEEEAEDAESGDY